MKYFAASSPTTASPAARNCSAGPRCLRAPIVTPNPARKPTSTAMYPTSRLVTIATPAHTAAPTSAPSRPAAAAAAKLDAVGTWAASSARTLSTHTGQARVVFTKYVVDVATLLPHSPQLTI